MIKAEEMHCSEHNEQIRFIQWLNTVLNINNYKNLNVDMANSYIDFMRKTPSSPTIPMEFLVKSSSKYPWHDPIKYQLNKSASKFLSSLYWSITDYSSPDFMIYFNDTTYTETKRKQLKKLYPDVDIDSIINFHDNLFKKFGVPEINLPRFDEWFTELVTRHKHNLTNEERNNHGIIITKEEQNSDYIYEGEFYNPYEKLLKANGWYVDNCYSYDHEYVLVKWDLKA